MGHMISCKIVGVTLLLLVQLFPHFKILQSLKELIEGGLNLNKYHSTGTKKQRRLVSSRGVECKLVYQVHSYRVSSVKDQGSSHRQLRVEEIESP
jgi:hypothetical protein